MPAESVALPVSKRQQAKLQRELELLALAQQILAQPDKLMPVQYYFAYLARQNEAWQQWYSYMQRAAEFGYPPAIQALAGLTPKPELPTERSD